MSAAFHIGSRGLQGSRKIEGTFLFPQNQVLKFQARYCGPNPKPNGSPSSSGLSGIADTFLQRFNLILDRCLVFRLNSTLTIFHGPQATVKRLPRAAIDPNHSQSHLPSHHTPFVLKQTTISRNSAKSLYSSSQHSLTLLIMQCIASPRGPPSNSTPYRHPQVHKRAEEIPEWIPIIFQICLTLLSASLTSQRLFSSHRPACFPFKVPASFNLDASPHKTRIDNPSRPTAIPSTVLPWTILDFFSQLF